MINYLAQYFYGPGSQTTSWLFGDYTNTDMKAVWQQTERVCKEGSYKFGGKTVQLEPHLSACVNGTFKKTLSIWDWIKELFFGKTYTSRGHQTKITVINRDALEVACSLKKKGFNPALLNPANAYAPGGGYKSGARAMEEDICRRSALALAIDSRHKKISNFYPLNGPELIYNPNVPIFRHGRARAYSYMDAPIPISVITSAAINLNSTHPASKAFRNNKEAFQKETERRIYAQLAIAADQGNDALVLTAFGCGAFRNSPKTVAMIYKRVIEAHFTGVFKHITFAVIDDHNSGRSHNQQGNFKPFQETFGT